MSAMTAKKNGRNRARRPKFRLNDDDIERVLKAMGSADLDKKQRLLLKRKINICLELAGKNSQYHEYHIPHKVIDDCQRIQTAVVALSTTLREPPNILYELAKEADRFPPCSSEIRAHRRERTLNCPSGKRKQGDVAGLLDRCTQAALVRRADAG